MDTWYKNTLDHIDALDDIMELKLATNAILLFRGDDHC